MKKTRIVALRALFALYVLVMLYLLFWQRSGRPGSMGYADTLLSNLNLVPFKTIRQFLDLIGLGLRNGRGALVRFSVVNLTGNVLMFVPLGIFLPALRPGLRSFGRFLLCAAGIVAAVELTQLFTLLGSCDVDDLILNLSGASGGYMIYKSAAPPGRRRTRRRP